MAVPVVPRARGCRTRGAVRSCGDNGAVIRLVATDLDGTFWDTHLVPPKAHVTAAKELVAAGVTVLVATSRRPRVVRRQLEEVGLALPAVLIDGAVGEDFRSGERFHQVYFDSEVALQVLTTFRAHALDPCLYVDHPEIDVMVSSDPSTCAEHLAYLGPVAAVGDLQATATMTNVYSFALLGLSRERLGPVVQALAVSDASSVVLYPEPAYGQFGLIVGPPGVSKWTGVDAYCRQHDIEPEEVLAVGDGLNDMTMLRKAGVAVGVRGGAPDVVALSEHLIDPPTANGWAQIIDLVDSSLSR
jgi:hydroxymethylpyrimidine pyrophosphatase-like HAD family hydrolase